MQNVYSHLPMVLVPGTVTKNSFSHPKASPKTNQNHFWRFFTYLFLLSLTGFVIPSDLDAQTCTCPGTNLVQNHSFENGTTNWNWSGGNFSAGSYAAQCGSNAGHFQITNTGNNYVSQQIGTMGSNGISAGSVLTLKVYGGTHNPSYYHQVGISYFTSNWTYISGNYTEVNAQLPSMSEYTVLSTVPSNAYYITVEKGGNGDWVKTDRWCVSLSQCDPENSSAPPYCAPQPNCPSGNNFMWSQSINSSDGSPSTVRLVCSSQLSYTIPGSYPSAFNGPVNVNVSDVVSWDGYSGRNSVTQQNERWRVVFKKNGSTVYATPYTNDVPDLQTQGYWRGSLGSTTYLPNGADQIIIEHWSVANNSNCSNGPNSVVPVSVCIGYTPVTCSNVTSGGQIGPNQNSCLATFDPAVINNITAPSGGSGSLEYMWLRSITTCTPPNGSNDDEWEVVSGANGSTYDPGPIYQNSCYIRCSRRSGCTNWDGESNVVSITVSGPAVQIASPLTLVKDRVISNEVHCSSSVQRVLWMDCLLDNAPGGTSGNAKYWKIISGGNFREYCDGTAYFEMRVQNLVTSTYQMDIKVVLSGRTHTAPSGSPHVEGCTSSASSDWYYYTNMTGTITGVNGLAGALLSIDRKMSSFQVGTNASLYANPGQFGASGWMIYNVINHPSSFKLQGECGADLNFLLSGGALSASQSIACSNICTGESTTLTANGGGGKPGYTYAWDNNLGTGQTKNINPSTTTTYKVTITDTNGCSSTSQTTIYVNPQPVLNAGQNVEICHGQSVLLTVNATNGTPPYTYTWSNPPGGTGTSKTVSPTTTTTYTVTVTDSKGCSDTDDVTVTVNPNPTVTTNANAVCTGNTLNITSTPSGGTPDYIYSWTGPNGFSASTQNISRPNATAAMAGSYNLLLTDSKECVATSSVNVNITPGATVDLGPDKLICEGDQIDIHSVVTGIPTCGTPGESDCNNPIVNSGGYIANLNTAEVCGDNAGAKLWTQGGNGTSYITLDMGSTRPIGTQICVRVKLEHCSGTNSTNSDMKIRWSLSAASGFSDIIASKTFSHTSYQTYCYNLTSAARYIRVQDNGKCSFRLDYVEFTTPDTYNSSVSYLWSGPGIIGANNGTSITVNQNGTYVLVVTDCNGCSASDDIIVDINNNVTANVDGAEICAGESVTLTATPIPGATYEWTEQGSNNIISTNQSITVSPTSTKVYILTVRVNGCEDSDDAMVIVNPNPTVTTAAQPVCIGSTLNITSTPNGGTPGYSYVWTGPSGFSATTQNINRVNAQVNMSGAYFVTVTDTKGCEATSSVQASVNPAPSVQVSAPEVCTGNTLTITATPSGGSPGYTYVWTGPSGFSANTQNVTRNNATTGMSGVYNVTVTDSQGCTVAENVVATVNPNLSITTSSVNVCQGGSLEISSSVSGGSPAYTYVWTGPNGFSANTQNILRPNSNTAMSGLYSVTVTDIKGCSGNSSVQAVVYPNPGLTANSNAPVCEGSTIQLSATPSGGTPTYTYQWTGPNGYSASMQNPVRNNATANMAGTYNVTATDANGCYATAVTIVSLTPNPESGISGPETTCAKEAVLFSATPPAGAGAVYSWTFQGGTPANANGPSASSQWNSPGTYLITLVVTKDGCLSQYTKNIIITEEVFSIAGPDKDICQGGLTTLNGQGPVGGNFTWTIVSGDPTSIDGGASQPNLNVSPLFTTVYRLTVSKNGCVRTDDVTVFVNVSLNPIADAGDPMEICSGITTIIGGNPTGTPPPGAPNTSLGYLWSPSAGLNTTTVANPNLTLNTPGTYTYQVIVVALVSGCTDTASVTHIINPNPSISASAPEVCAGYALEITSTPSGGTPGYTYNWSGPGGYTSSTQNILRANSTTAMSGLYSVTVTDTKGCVGTGSVQAIVNPNPLVSASAPEVCAGYALEITSTPSGGTPGYTYDWSGPGGYTSSTQNILRVNSTTAMSGLYSVTVTDTKGCVGTGSVQATVNPNPNVVANSNSPVCQGETITLTSSPSGGSPGYTYSWAGPNGFTASIQNPSRPNANNTMSGDYSVTITDTKGCVASASTNVTLAPKPISGIQGPSTTCAREAAFFIANPPAGPGTTYTWTFQGGNPASAMGPSASSQWDVPGEYLITLVVDKNGCDTMYTKSIIITQEVFSIAGPDKEICQGGNVTLNGQGPAGANFSWSVVAGDGTSIDNGGATMNLLVSPIYTTVYRLTVSQNGCVRTDEVTVFVNVNLNPIADAGPPLQICAGTTTIIGGNPTGTPPPAAPNTPLGYIWSPATGLNAITLPNPTLTLNAPGSYTYQVIVIALTTGCTDTATVTHVVEPKAKVGDFVWEDLNGNGRQDLGEPGINGVSVTLHNASNNAIVASTNTSTRNSEAGYYDFEVCKGSYYVVFGDVNNYNRTPKNAPGSNNTNDSDANTTTGKSDNFNLNPGDFNQTIDAGYYRPARLGDFVWEDLNVNGIQDLNEPGISGVVVRLLDENGVQLAFTTTNINGLYYFNNLRPGNYIVKFDTKAGYIPTTKDVLPDDAKDSDADPITGRSHLITLVSGQEDLTIDAGYYRLARIGDFVWEDTNLNNLQDAFEPVLPNVQVMLSGNKGTDGSAVNLFTSTDNTGFYDFNNLTPGTYTVTFTRPSSIYLSVQPNAGADNIDSDADMVTGQTGPYNLQSGEYNNTVDAGYYRCARVGDFVWVDLGTTPNIQDAGDIGINNVEVRLYQSGTNTLVETQFTRNSPVDGRAGYYLFECVPPGQYYVKVIKPSPTATIVRYDFVQPNQGGNDMLDSDVVDFLNGTTLTFTVGYAQTILDVDIGLITVLPVHVKEITGWWDKVNDVNELTWTTTQETNNSHFIIERSFEGSRFYEIGRVDGKGFSAQDVQYFFTDQEISKNGSYVYQVSQADFDGKVSKVGIVEIIVGRDNTRGAKIYPNPTYGSINIEISANEGDELSYELFDATGKLVRKFEIGVVDQKGTMLSTIDLTGYAQGIYYAKVKIGDQNIVQRIVKIE